jgi:hypothetical protein
MLMKKPDMVSTTFLSISPLSPIPSWLIKMTGITFEAAYAALIVQNVCAISFSRPLVSS